MRRAAGVQSVTQIEQALHSSVFMAGFGHWERFTGTRTFPAPSVTAFLGHTRPQTPQATQREGLMTCSRPRSPEMANTGQFLAQAVQPIQSSVM